MELSALDVRTLSFVAAIGGALMSATMLGLHVAGARHGRALGFWGIAGLLWLLGYLTGFLIPVLSTAAAPPVVASLANFLIGCGFVFVLFGIQAYLERRPWYLAMAACALVVAVIIIAFPDLRDPVRARQIVFSIWYVLATAAAGILMAVSPAAGLTPYRRVVAAILLIYSLFLVLRMSVVFLLDGPLESFAPTTLQVGVFLVATLVSFSLSLAFAVLLLRTKELDLKYLARHDPLTGLGNRYSMEESAAREIARTERYGNALSVIVVDLDHFKRLNDEFGHHDGDQALKRVADLLLDNVRDADMVFRLGGEEFLILLPDTGLEGAEQIAERIRRNLEATSVALAEGRERRITASFGVTEYRPGDQTWSGLIREADDAMYVAKRNGRNRVETPSAASPPSRRHDSGSGMPSVRSERRRPV
ncbi:MAG: diguanylate cyclase [Candidatus Wenzhouxiangella sp. M2_3B_020]